MHLIEKVTVKEAVVRSVCGLQPSQYSVSNVVCLGNIQRWPLHTEATKANADIRTSQMLD